MDMPGTPVQVFCSFAPEDTDLCRQLLDHLRLLERQGTLAVWHTRLITAGTNLVQVVDEHLAHASIILLLISPAFLASDYCYSKEMQQAMQRHDAKEARVIPILLRPVDWASAPFAHLSALPSTGKAVAEWRYRDAAFADIVGGLRHVLEDLAPASPNSSLISPALSIWNVPYKRNPHFTGREELLDRLDQQLSLHSTATRRAALTQPQAIKGLGGIGKTQIAVEYAYRAREQDHYIHTFWVNAASEEALIASFITIAELLPAFPARNERDQRKLAAAIQRWLEQCEQPWLLIFDNADDIAIIQEYLPQRGNGSILLTTRANAVGSLASSIEVETMSFVEGTHLLLRRAQRFALASNEEINEAGNIVIALDHFPLALDQAGAYIDETTCSFDEYLTLYQSHRQTLLARRGGQIVNYPDSVATTWSLSFQKVEQANPAAAELLRLCTFLAPDHIPEELLKEGASYWPPLLQQAANDLFAFNQMLEDLLRFSLVKRLAKDHLLSIHRLVQAVQIEKIEREKQVQWAERVIRAVNAVFPRDPRKDPATWPRCLRYLEQAQACDLLIQQYHMKLLEAADLLSRTSIYLREHALYSIAEPLSQRAFHIREQQLGPEHPDIAQSLNDLAILYYYQGKYEQAEPLYQKALAIREQQLGPEHPDTAVSLNNLAILYKHQGKYKQTESLYQRAFHIREQQLGPEHPDTAVSLNNLAELYRLQGKYEQAEPLYQRALSIKERQVGLEHPSTTISLNNLAILYRQQEKYEQAEPLFLRALHIREKLLGPEHPDTAVSLNNLAILYHSQGKYEQAEPLFLRAFHIREQQLGPGHPDTAQSLSNLAILYYYQGKYKQAESLHQRALAIREQQLGPEHPDTAISLNSLAVVYRQQNNYTEAERLFLRALLIREQALLPADPYLAETLFEFAVLRQAQSKLDEAQSFYQRALDARAQTLGAMHPKTIEAREGLIVLLHSMGRMKEAGTLEEEQNQCKQKRSSQD